jgi:phasin family protein
MADFLNASSLGSVQNLNTSAPRNGQARTAIPAQTWRSLGLYFVWEQKGAKMMGTDQDKSLGKPAPRGRKAERRSPKSERQQSPMPDQPQEAKPQIEATVMSTDAAPIDAIVPADTAPVGAVVLADTSPIGAVAAAEPVPISFQTIANAYGDYTRKSLEETRSFVEQLTGARSLDKAIEIQAEFAKHACATFLADSQRIWELYSELTRQIFKPLQGFLTKTTQAAR